MTEIIRGKTFVAKFRSIEHALSALAKRIPKRIPVIMPSIPWMFYAPMLPQGGTLCRLIAPCSLSIPTLWFSLAHFTSLADPDRGMQPLLYIERTHLDTSQHAPFPLSSHIHNFPLNIALDPGDSLTFTLAGVDTATEISLSLLLVCSEQTATRLLMEPPKEEG